MSECIVIGNQVPLGTGLFKVCYDEKMSKTRQKKKVKKPEQEDLLFDMIE